METKELVAQLNAHRKEVADVRKALNELDAEKESWFKKKEEMKPSPPH